MQPLLNVNLEKNSRKFWRPWHKFDDMDRVLRSATDQEYKNILKELIRGEVVLPLETEKKKRIQLEKKQKNQQEQIGSWIKLEEPADEINCVEIGDISGKGKQYIKIKGYKMFAGNLEDMVGCKNKHKPITVRTRKIRRMYIRILHNLTFKKNHIGNQ